MHKTPAPIVEPCLDLTEVADWLKVSRRTIERLIASGELKAIKIGARIRVEPRSLSEFLDRAEVAQ
jgi:excisionase family DNA binding protein